MADSNSRPGLADTSAVDHGDLNRDERSELTRLRAELDSIRSQRPTPGGRRHGGWRAPVAATLIVLGCLLAPVSVLAVWGANEVSNTSRYVANVEPLIHQPAIQRALTDKITNAVTSQINVQARANQAASNLAAHGLPGVSKLLRNFSGSLAGAVTGFVHSTVSKVITSSQAAALWTQVNRATHAQLVKALSGQGNGAITVSNGKVTVSLGPFIKAAEKRLSARGLTVVNNLPPINPTIALFSAKYLVKAQSAYRLVTTLKWVLPLLALAFLAAGVYVARGHRRALIGVGLGLAASMLALGIALAIGRTIYLGSVPPSVLPADAAAAAFDTLVRFIKEGVRTLLVVGLVVAAGAFLTGPSVTAAGIRRRTASALGWLRTTVERAGVSAGPVGTWTYAHRRGLRISAVALAALIFVFCTPLTALAALVTAILLVIGLGLIELLGRPQASRQASHGLTRRIRGHRIRSASRRAAVIVVLHRVLC